MRTRQRSAMVTAALAVYVAVGALLSFLGWVLDIPALTDWDLDGVAIQPNAAVAALSSAAAVLFVLVDRRRVAIGCGALTAIIGALTLFQHVSGSDVGIDRLLLFDRTWGALDTLAPGRMGPPASLAWTLAGVAAVLLAVRRTGAVPAIGLTIGALATLSLTGRLSGADALYGLPELTAIAMQTATFVLGMGLALVTSVPERNPTRTMLADSSAGVLARQTLPFLIGMPIVLSALVLWGVRVRLYDQAMGSALLLLGVLLVVCAVVWRGIQAVDLRERALIETQRVLRDSDERLRRQTEELKEADRRKDEFLATLAHELRNPLAPLRTGLELITHPRTSREIFTRTHQTMARQVDHLVRLIDDLMDVSRITRGIVTLSTRPLAPALVVERAVEMGRPSIEAGRHRLSIAVDDDLPLIEVDEARVTQVLSNLINNAAKFTPPGGEIAISARRNGERVDFSVKDTGAGLTAEMVTRVFDMFAQAEHPLRRSQSGLGIGLALVKGLVELHGGSVKAFSAGPGTGSEFTVSLPVAVRGVQAEAASAPLAAALRRRVLVVDDNVDAAEGLALMLALEGHDAEVAHDAEEALRKAETRPPDLVFLDIGMPNVNGYEACRRIRSLPWGRGVTVVALTGWGHPEDRQRSHDAGFDDHLVKPADPQDLRKLLAASAVGSA